MSSQKGREGGTPKGDLRWQGGWTLFSSEVMSPQRPKLAFSKKIRWAIFSNLKSTPFKGKKIWEGFWNLQLFRVEKILKRWWSKYMQKISNYGCISFFSLLIKTHIEHTQAKDFLRNCNQILNPSIFLQTIFQSAFLDKIRLWLVKGSRVK